MNQRYTEYFFLLMLLTAITILVIMIFWPFFYALVLSLVFATVFSKAHKKILFIFGGRKALAALSSMLLVFLVVVAPIVLAGLMVVREATQLYNRVIEGGGAEGITNSINAAVINIKNYIPFPVEFSVDFGLWAKQALTWIIGHLGSFFANVLNFFLETFIFLIALYYLFRDGEAIKKAVYHYSPLADEHNRSIFKKLELAVNSVVKGNLLIAFIQGALASLGFLVFGVPNAALWGSVAAISALIPGVGTSLVIFPAVLYLFFAGKTIFALGLFIWGITAVGLIDNFLTPKLIGQGMKLHPFLTLLAIFGGLSVFGPLGFLLGPLVLGLFFALVEISFIFLKNSRVK